MNLPTIQIPYYFTDQRHSGYADAVMAGKVSSANFVFVSDVEDIAPILPEEPDLRLGSPEHFLGAFMAALAKPENLKALPHIIAFWQDRRLAPLSLLAEAYLGVGLQKYARDAQVPQQRTLYRQAVAKLKREITKNASPVTPQALELLCLWPDIAAQKLGLLVEGADYSPVLAKLGFTGTARNIAAFLLKNGFARNLRAITGYLLPLLETLQETAGKTSPETAGKAPQGTAGKTSPGTAHNTLPPEKLTLGAAAEIALANGVSELVRRRENLDSSDYRDLSRCLYRIRPGVALNIFLKLIGADLVTETRHVMEMRTNREIVVHSPDTVFSWLFPFGAAETQISKETETKNRRRVVRRCAAAGKLRTAAAGRRPACTAAETPRRLERAAWLCPPCPSGLQRVQSTAVSLPVCRCAEQR